MSFHYYTICDCCGKQSEQWDGIPEGWLGINTADAIHLDNAPKHLCDVCVAATNIPKLEWRKS